MGLGANVFRHAKADDSNTLKYDVFYSFDASQCLKRCIAISVNAESG
jgi:hypothetical protein